MNTQTNITCTHIHTNMDMRTRVQMSRYMHTLLGTHSLEGEEKGLPDSESPLAATE